MADHIQVGDIVPRESHAGDGATTSFEFPFPIFTDADLEVYVDGVRKTLNTDYTMTGAGQSDGGQVTFTSVPDTAANILFLRRLTIARTSDFQASGEFRAKVINDELDFQTATLQQINDDLGRTIRLARTDAIATLELPDSTSRSNGLLGFDANGDLSVTALGSVGGIAAISSTTPLGGSASGSAGSSNQLSAADHRHPLPALTDLGLASQAEAEAGTDNTKAMTPLRTAQAIAQQFTGTDVIAREMAVSALAYAMAANDATSIIGTVGKFWLSDDFQSDSLATATNATYDAGGDFYGNPSAYTADLCAGGTATGSTEYTPASLAFNDSTADNNSWYNYPETVPAWLQYEFASPKTIAMYTITSDSGAAYRCPTDWVFQGYNGATWDDLDTVSGQTWSGTQSRTYDVDSPDEYTKYRLYITGTTGGADNHVVISEMQMMEALPSANMTLSPSKATLDTADPVDVIAYFMIDPEDDVDFGTDIIGRISIDDGANKVTGTWTKVGVLSTAGPELWRLEADVSEEAGSELVYELTTFNNKQFRLHNCVGLIATY